LFGGPVVAIVAGCMAAVYRIYLGGSGMITGVGSIIISVASGIFYRSYIKNIKNLSFWKLLLFGFCVHLILIIWFATIPGGVYLDVIHLIAVGYLSVFPVATAILGSVIVDQEKRYFAEERSRINAQKYRTLIETAPEIIMTLDREGMVQFINQLPPYLQEEEIKSENIYSFMD
jgi:LytS/YehU family sensor histidine kinase